jgi:hypothetical protein
MNLLRETLHEDVVHYFLSPNTGSAPVRTREHLSRYWRKVTRMIGARWVVENSVTTGDETVIEWSMFWAPEPGEDRIVTRGAEWFVFREGLIFEIRSYYQQHPFTSQLDSFDYDSRGFSTVGNERSKLHVEAGDIVPVGRATQ